MWNVDQYEKYRDERAQPFLDLLSRVTEPDFGTVADLGCGTGELTRLLVDRFPQAAIVGFDHSAEMLAAAQPRAVPSRLRFENADILRVQGSFDLIVSNAALQWLPHHQALLARLTSQLTPQGVLAVQMPANFDAPSHTIVAELMQAHQGGSSPRPPVLPIAAYVEILHALGLRVTAWETTYQHVLSGENAVLEWLKGTTLVSFLPTLGEHERQQFLARCAERLTEAYPPTEHGTLFPFKRIFFVARRRLGAPQP
jgi:trans-aconitate 2-methyltransferase